ncbi:MAG TPA: GYF domain-containing protein [Bryobacteraceae bacterium]|nr:GYF domain-containing protein [Bryobacteraceae bacterium]
MNYYIARDGQQFGPYTLAEVQQYVKDGNILLTDLAHSEGMASWVPVQQILGNIPVPQQPAPAPNYGQVPVYQQPQAVAPQPGNVIGAGPLPPDLHWALVLLLGVITCGIFSYVWMFVQAGFVRKLQPSSNGMMLYALGLPGIFLGEILQVAGGSEDSIKAVGGLIVLAGAIMIIVGHFSLRRSLEDYYNSVEPVNLQLSGVMTFFFNTIYFQYHLNWIRQYKLTGVARR